MESPGFTPGEDVKEQIGHTWPANFSSNGLGLDVDNSINLKSRSVGVNSWFARQLDDQKPKSAIASLDGVRGIAFLIVLLLHVSTMANRLGLWRKSNNP